jgi:hypothetical protein
MFLLPVVSFSLICRLVFVKCLKPLRLFDFTLYSRRIILLYEKYMTSQHVTARNILVSRRILMKHCNLAYYNCRLTCSKRVLEIRALLILILRVLLQRVSVELLLSTAAVLKLFNWRITICNLTHSEYHQ